MKNRELSWSVRSRLNVRQTGRGGVVVSASGEVDGNVTESGRGHLYIFRTADIDGSIRETGPGRRINR